MSDTAQTSPTSPSSGHCLCGAVSYEVCAGTLDLPTGLRTERSVFTDDDADYHNLDPSVAAQCQESPYPSS